LTAEPDETVASLLARLGIPTAEVYTVFLNHRLLYTRCRQARWTGHPKAREDLFDPDLAGSSVASGDRLGIFGRDMSLLVV
jgi:hypothetical protein